MPNSPWTETGSSISLVPTTTTIGSDPENVNYLSNQDKINLMAQYAAELAMKTSLDTLASTWSVSSTFYDNAVAAISTALINAGAPANWATTWPDGTTSGPWPGIQTSLANLWAQVATQRTALQSVISNAQAAAAQTAAIAAAATDATNKMNAAITAVGLAPVVVSSLPVLPSATYPSGRLVWNTADGQLYRSTGSAWTALTVSAPDISGTLTAAQIASVAASQVTGQLSDSQLAAISAAKLTGQITGTQITNGAISTPQLAAGAVTAATIAANTITASQIAAGTVTATQIAAGTVTAANIAAGTIQASNIAAATITGDKIAANAITTTQIAANTITAGDIAANTITAGQIAAGAIGATQIAAGAITTAALTVCDWENQCYNPGFETGTNAQWDSGSVSTAYANTGSYSLKLPNGGGTYAVRNLNRIPVVAGQVFLAQCWVYVAAALSSGGAYVRVRGLNASGTEVWEGASGTVSTPVGAWTQLSTTQTVPAGVVAANLEIVSASPVGGDIYVDDCYFRRCNDASLIVDGSITATKIAAGAISASMITTGTLNAANVAVTNLNASNITTGTLAASKVSFPDGSVLTTAGVQTTVLTQSTTANTTSASSVAIPGLSGSFPVASANDVFNVIAMIYGEQTAGTVPNTNSGIALYVNGAAVKTNAIIFNTLNQTQQFTLIWSLTGLSAGSSTIAFYLSPGGFSGQPIETFLGSSVMVQRIF